MCLWNKKTSLYWVLFSFLKNKAVSIWKYELTQQFTSLSKELWTESIFALSEQEQVIVLQLSMHLILMAMQSLHSLSKPYAMAFHQLPAQRHLAELLNWNWLNNSFSFFECGTFVLFHWEAAARTNISKVTFSTSSHSHTLRQLAEQKHVLLQLTACHTGSKSKTTLATP